MAKRKISAALALMLMTLFMTVSAECATGMISQNGSGDIYITETGWVTVDGGIYYVHATKSQMYDRHEACRNTYRWRGNKLYYFRDNGKMLKKSTKYIKLNRDHSIRYIYTPGTNHNERWSSRLL